MLTKEEKREIQEYRLLLNTLIISDGSFKKELSQIEIIDFKFYLTCFLKRFSLAESLQVKIQNFLNQKEFLMIEASSILALLATIEKPVRFSAN